MKELVIACCRVAQKDPHKFIDEQDKEYWRWRDVILLSEDIMLEAVCFDLSLEPPYKTLIEQLIFFGEGENNKLRNAAWAFVNDSYLTMLCLLFPSRTIATSALYAAAKHCAVTFPDYDHGRPWWNIFDVELEDIRGACNYMASIYAGAPSKGRKEGGMYEQRPETGDGADDRTRAARPTGEGLRSPRGSRINGLAASSMNIEANGASNAANIVDKRATMAEKPSSNGAKHDLNSGLPMNCKNDSRRKRQRVEDDKAPSHTSLGPHEDTATARVSDGNLTSQDLETSRSATQPNGTYPHGVELSDRGDSSSLRVEDVSEEGEVEA